MWLPGVSQKGMKICGYPSFTAVNGQLRVSKSVEPLQWIDCGVQSQRLASNWKRANVQRLALRAPGKERLVLRFPNLLCILH